jgi:hypothetical protein
MAEYLTVDQAVVGSTPIRHPKYGGKPPKCPPNMGIQEASYQRGLFFTATLLQPGIVVAITKNIIIHYKYPALL